MTDAQPRSAQGAESVCRWCRCDGFHAEDCEGFEINDPARTVAARHADLVRCADCDSTCDRVAVYEVRTPERMIGSVVERHIFWVCPTCWDRLVNAAAFAITRGAF